MGKEAAGRKGKRDRRIPGIIGSKNNGRSASAYISQAVQEGGRSDGDGARNKKQAVSKKKKRKKKEKQIASISLWGQIFFFFKQEVVIPSLCSVVTSSIKYIKPPHKKGIKQSI